MSRRAARDNRGLGRSRRATLLPAIAALVSGTIMPAAAQSPDFTPTAEYHLCSEDSADECVHDYYTDSAVQFRIALAQEQGEEELEHITLKFAPGFRFPKDAQIPNGEQLGSAHIETGAGPGCAGAEGTAPLAIDGRFEERDRTDAEIAESVRVVFRLNLDPIPPLDIVVYGNARKGHHVEAAIEDRPTTCPPFTFNGTFFASSADTGIPILRTPRTPGRYSLRAILTGTQDSLVAYRYRYKFTP